MSDHTARMPIDLLESDAIGFGAKEKLIPKQLFTRDDLDLNMNVEGGAKAAADDFLTCLDNGKFVSLWTSSGGENLCGMFVIRDSIMAMKRQNPRMPLPVPTVPGLMWAFRNQVYADLKKRNEESYVGRDVPSFEINVNNFAGDELRLIFRAWAKNLGPLITDHWGGVDVGLMTQTHQHPERKRLLFPAIEVPEETEPGLPILRPYILNTGHGHWEGLAKSTPHLEQQSSRQPNPGIQPQPQHKYPQQASTAAANHMDPFSSFYNAPLVALPHNTGVTLDDTHQVVDERLCNHASGSQQQGNHMTTQQNQIADFLVPSSLSFSFKFPMFSNQG